MLSNAGFDDLLSDVNAQPSGWPLPLVAASWPQNPGPTGILAGVASEGRCDSCHRAGSAGRFPELSQELPGYCGTILESAIAETMPPYGMDGGQYAAHIEALRNACDRPRRTGQDEPFEPPLDSGFVSPPIVIGPLYACAEQVAVQSAIYGADLTLQINGVELETRAVDQPDLEVFSVPALVVGDVVTAVQKVDGFASDPSATETARDHTVDYPDGLPAPVITPTLIYECAATIAVTHVPGARLTVYSDGADPNTTYTSTDYSVGYPSKIPFVVGESFEAEISLCDDTSLRSGDEQAVAAPSFVPAPTFDPPETFVGQQLITITSRLNGSFTTVGVSSVGDLPEQYSYPVSWTSNYNFAGSLGHPLAPGEVMTARQRLCVEGPDTKTPEPLDCPDLPAPRISPPVAGQDYVVVTQSVPGARIRVFDAATVEIGDSAGPVVILSRVLVGGDVLRVVQTVGQCTSDNAYRIEVPRQ